MSPYNHTTIEKKWQERWEEAKLYVADIDVPINGHTKTFYDSESKKVSKKPFYNLWMFPYPSAEGLHAGHAFASTGSDIVGRYMRMNGKDVFQPIGYDSFGIHSENYAIKINENPQKVVERTTKHYEEQMRSLGHGYDWTRTVTTSDPDYYRWTQWLFIKLFEAGLAYKKTATVNFCPSCRTVLADEQVMSPKAAGKDPKNANGEVIEYSEELKVCERCGTIVEKKDLDQWFFKITAYADKLLAGLDKIDWSQRVISAQRNWIGKSEGMLINFKKEDGRIMPVFTTRPDTLNAVTFIAVTDEKLWNEGQKEKLGEDTGEFALNPLNSQKVPIWKTNYIAPGYGTGVVMGVPAHDERDMEFAKKYHLDIVEKDPDESLRTRIEKEGWGKKHTNYHLRDWLVSRQRYWGAPIPMIDCPKCGWVTVPEKDLPLLLPSISDYKPEGTGRGPLADHPEFYQVACPECGQPARRETDVMDTFVDSSWYFLRYPSVGDNKNAFDPKITKKWLPVNLYFGGAEHSVLHLMYSRFVTMVLHDLKYIDFDEPFPKFFAHGLMIKDGAKMSKSRGNVVNPDEYVSKFGADSLRLYLAFMGPMDSSPDFQDSGIEGSSRFLGKVWRLFHQPPFTVHRSPDDEVTSKLHQTIKKVTKDIEGYKFNTAISSLMELVNVLTIHRSQVTVHQLSILAQLLAPFAPHLSEEVWHEVLGFKSSVHKSDWPKYDDSLIRSDTVTIVIQINGKVRSQLIIAHEVMQSNLQFTNKRSLTLEGDKQSLAKSEFGEEEVTKLAKEDENVAKWLTGKEIVKTIFIPGRILNFVVR